MDFSPLVSLVIFQVDSSLAPKDPRLCQLGVSHTFLQFQGSSKAHQAQLPSEYDDAGLPLTAQFSCDLLL